MWAENIGQSDIPTVRQLNSPTQEQQNRRIAEQLNRLSSCRKVGQSEAPTSCQAEANGTKDSSSQFVGNEIVNECEILNKMMNLCERSACVKRARISQATQLVRDYAKRGLERRFVKNKNNAPISRYFSRFSRSSSLKC